MTLQKLTKMRTEQNKNETGYRLRTVSGTLFATDGSNQ
jgi:hypothetical protein